MEEKAPSIRSKHIVAAVGSVLVAVTIGSSFLWGDPNNAIHLFSNTAAWGLVYIIVAGYGLGKAVDAWTTVFKK